jgi:hypothetical protein
VQIFEALLFDICKAFIIKESDRSDTAERVQSLRQVLTWPEWRERLFDLGVLTRNTLNEDRDQRLNNIFSTRDTLLFGGAGKTQEISNGYVAESISLLSDTGSLIVKASGWKLMTPRQG